MMSAMAQLAHCILGGMDGGQLPPHGTVLKQVLTHTGGEESSDSGKRDVLRHEGQKPGHCACNDFDDEILGIESRC